MGGIPTNWKGQVLNPNIHNENAIVHGLWAAGEVRSSSVHGANRLGANSLLDIVVFGKACAENIETQNTPQENIEHHDSKILQENIDKYENILHKKGTISVAELRLEMKNHAKACWRF